MISDIPPTIANLVAPKTASDFAFLFFAIVIPLLLLPAIVFRFEKLRRSWFGFVFRWGGHWPWSFPASRFGSIVGCLIPLLIGLLAIEQSRYIPAQIWIVSLVTIALLVPIAAVYDYIHYKHGKKSDQRNEDSAPLSPRLFTSIMEIHDSTVSAIARTPKRGFEILFTPAYIQKSRGRPGYDAGIGWLQNVRLRLGNASISGSSGDLPSSLMNGTLRIGMELYTNEIPIPLKAEGSIALTLDFDEKHTLSIRAVSIELDLVDEPKYVEQFGDNRAPE